MKLEVGREVGKAKQGLPFDLLGYSINARGGNDVEVKHVGGVTILAQTWEL